MPAPVQNTTGVPVSGPESYQLKRRPSGKRVMFLRWFLIFIVITGKYAVRHKKEEGFSDK